jgi:transposase
MSEKQWKRLDIVERLKRGGLTTGEAAQMTGLSRRQVQRMRLAFEERGQAAVVHGNKRRPPPNRIAEEIRQYVIELARGKYVGFNDQHLTEKLVEVEGISVSRASVQRWLRAAGVGAARKRRPPKHRRRRDRKPQAGAMILWDGSRHDWLEGRGPILCLMGAIDDATGELLPGAHFVEQECAVGYLRVLLGIAQAKGLPLSAYMDRHGSLRRNDDHWTLAEELAGEQFPTQVGRALKALGVEVIFALSPQAKGRVERLWGTLQDRLVSELRLKGACTVEQANAVLERYRAEHNRRFAIAPQNQAAAWRPVRGLDLERICSFDYEATVQNDNTVRLDGVVIDIPPGPRERSYAKAKVEVRQLLDGTWRVYLRDHLIATAAATQMGELRARRQRKRSAASRAFRKAVLTLDTSVLERRRGRAQPSSCGQPADRLPTRTPRRLTPPPPFNSRPRNPMKQKTTSATKSLST